MQVGMARSALSFPSFIVCERPILLAFFSIVKYYFFRFQNVRSFFIYFVRFLTERSFSKIVHPVKN